MYVSMSAMSKSRRESTYIKINHRVRLSAHIIYIYIYLRFIDLRSSLYYIRNEQGIILYYVLYYNNYIWYILYYSRTRTAARVLKCICVRTLCTNDNYTYIPHGYYIILGTYIYIIYPRAV